MILRDTPRMVSKNDSRQSQTTDSSRALSRPAVDGKETRDCGQELVLAARQPCAASGEAA
jgi:hypothetical protein